MNLEHYPLLAYAAQRQMADTSLDAWESIRQDLQAREIHVFKALHLYLEATGHADATGGELTEWMVKHKLAHDVNDVRPRLTGLADKGWLWSFSKRPSRAARERPSHPYYPVLPLSALDRLEP